MRLTRSEIKARSTRASTPNDDTSLKCFHGFTSSTRKSLSHLVNSIFVPFPGPALQLDFDDPNTLFEIVRLVCSCAEPELLTCRARLDENQLCGLGSKSVVGAMCGVSFALEDDEEDLYEELRPRCLFCNFDVLPPPSESMPDDMELLMRRHSSHCSYRWLFVHMSRRCQNAGPSRLSEANKSLLLHLRREMTSAKVDFARDLRHPVDAICTAIAQRYLGGMRTGTNCSFRYGVSDLVASLSKMAIPVVPGFHDFVNSFQEDGDSFNRQVWPPRRDRSRTPRWSRGFRQMILLPKLSEE